HFFFFSSRRRHTRFSRDWSSDVCSSDLHSEFVNLVERMLEDERVINDFYCECGDEWSCNEDFEERDPEITASCFQTALDQIEPKIGRASCRAKVASSVTASI